MSDDLHEALGLDDVDVVHAVDPEVASSLRYEASAKLNTMRAAQEAEVRMRKHAFQRVFRDGGASLDDIHIVMTVLRRFCRWRESTFHEDPRKHALAEGRREVILHVDDYCELSIDDLVAKLA